VPDRSLLPGQTIQVSVPLSVRHGRALGVTAVFYDGDPHDGGKPSDAERASYIGPRDPYEAKVSYRANSCGRHEALRRN
jgi:hypothetical protein